jgi:hypothetical protein
MAFPTTTIYHLPMMHSDHAPILAVLKSTSRKTRKPFRFDNWWLMDQQYQEVAQESWSKSSSRIFTQKTRYLAADLRSWRRSKPRNCDMLATIEAQLLDEQSKPPDQQDYNL